MFLVTIIIASTIAPESINNFENRKSSLQDSRRGCSCQTPGGVAHNLPFLYPLRWLCRLLNSRMQRFEHLISVGFRGFHLELEAAQPPNLIEMMVVGWPVSVPVKGVASQQLHKTRIVKCCISQNAVSKLWKGASIWVICELISLPNWNIH